MATPTKTSTTQRVEEMLQRIAELEEEVQRLRAQVQAPQVAAGGSAAPVKPGAWINPTAHKVRPSQVEVRAEAARSKIAGTWADPAIRRRSAPR